MADEQPQGNVAVNTKTLVDALVLLIPLAVSVTQFLKEERSYELIFLAFAVAMLYFFIRALSNSVALLRGELVAERTAHLATRSNCEANDEKWAANLEALRVAFEGERNRIYDKFRQQVQVLETSLINAVHDIGDPTLQGRIGRMDRDPVTGMLIYSPLSPRNPTIIPPQPPIPPHA